MIICTGDFEIWCFIFEVGGGGGRGLGIGKGGRGLMIVQGARHTRRIKSFHKKDSVRVGGRGSVSSSSFHF